MHGLADLRRQHGRFRAIRGLDDIFGRSSRSFEELRGPDRQRLGQCLVRGQDGLWPDPCEFSLPTEEAAFSATESAESASLRIAI
jgi:hypothetical protein